ncbi:MAG TPA: ACP S-malonyltransferase [Candidatus Krumholzibacteria bacterium]|nr:ACP S-malonyltransferase [Candidatus Krumholzibacteria bacterium]
MSKDALGFLFPGQASQSVGMGKDLVGTYPRAKEIFQRADEALGFSLSKLCFEGPMDELTQTRNAQPAILAHSLAVHAVLAERVEVQPLLAAGHSLGEISAAAAAGALKLEDAVRVVRARGELMWEAGQRQEGTMAAVVGLAQQAVEEVCESHSQSGHGVVVVANLNSPGQMVISGDVAAVRSVAAPLKEAGARRVLPLKVSGAFHSPLMECVQADFAQVLEGVEVADPAYGIVSNVSAEPVHEASRIKKGLVAQLVSPVRWNESVARMIKSGVSTLLELGPGNVLTNLGARDFKDAEFIASSNGEGVEKMLATLQGSM